MEQREHCNIPLDMEAFPGAAFYREAGAAACRQIDSGYPVPFLLLRHKNTEKYKDFIWHWFLLVGYEEEEGELLVKAATYGESILFPFRELWDTGYEEKGGMVLFKTSDGNS